MSGAFLALVAVGFGLALVIALYRRKQTVSLDVLNELRD